MKLALKLKLGDDNLYKLNEAPFTDTLAYEVLIKWIEEQDEEATVCALHAALCDAERLDLANRFKDRLFGRGKTCADASLLSLSNLCWLSCLPVCARVSP